MNCTKRNFIGIYLGLIHSRFGISLEVALDGELSLLNKWTIVPS
ncbi:unnamed protein product [Acidithrix sp. C25]|nr:unnamed protein product [Acidithrix sp. C25]